MTCTSFTEDPVALVNIDSCEMFDLSRQDSIHYGSQDQMVDYTRVSPNPIIDPEPAQKLDKF